jgi:hypothetical protein
MVAFLQLTYKLQQLGNRYGPCTHSFACCPVGHYSPIVKQLRGKAKPDGMVLVVGGCAEYLTGKGFCMGLCKVSALLLTPSCVAVWLITCETFSQKYIWQSPYLTGEGGRMELC